MFMSFSVAAVAFFYSPLKDLLMSSLDNQLYSHIALVPLVSGYFLYHQRKNIFSEKQYSFKLGGILVAISLLLYITGKGAKDTLNHNDYLSLMTFSALVCWTGGFTLFYGGRALRNAAFPLGFLVFMVPVPSPVMERIIVYLQNGSAGVANVLFALTGVPYLRDGFTFHLPSLSVEVAEQCSGIRSTLALFITSVLAGHIFLRSGWKKALLGISIFPITIFKNGLRIVTLTLLGAYVDPRILSGSLHRKGGIPFFILALACFMPIVWYLRKTENNKPVETESK